MISPRRKSRFKVFKIIILPALGLFLALSSALIVWASILPIPDLQSFESRKVIQSTKIYDNTGKIILYDIHQNISRTVIPFDEIPRDLKNATVAIEDSNFYQHQGISWEGIIRAFWINLGSGYLKQGGSTITQQLAKNALLTSEKSITRKVKEIILAIKLEKMLSKEDILNLYLNEVPYGGNIYGTEAAAQYFFGKHAKDITLPEAAYLSSLPKAPTYYSPYGNHREELNKRKDVVLDRMLELKFLSENETLSAKQEKVDFIPRSEQNIKAPHFVMYIKGYLERKYGKDAVEERGLKITTTLDWDLQQKAEMLVSQYTKENEKKFNAKNAGLVAIDPGSGKILAMVGSRDYFDIDNDGNFNVTLAKRQPGSSFKPFVYAAALKKGYTPETTLFDLKTEFNASCNPDGSPQSGTRKEDCYHPENYDNIFRGPITIRNALAQSVNIPSVKLLYLTGLNESLETAKSMGITTLADPGRYGLTLVLGGGETTLLEMTSAYSVFANDGARNPAIGILKIEDNKGNILEELAPQPKQVLDPNVSRQINDILSDNKARTPAFGEQSFLYFPNRDVAAKTGTTNDYRDAWVIGYTPNFSLGVWAGNNDNSPMEKKVAGFIAAPLWNAFFQEALKNLPEKKFTKPAPIDDNLKPVLKGDWKGGHTYLIDSISKKRATEFTPKELTEERTLIQIHSILYWVKKENPLGPVPETPDVDPQFFLWEKPVRDWAKKQKIQEEDLSNSPQQFDDIHLPEYAPKIEIISPQPDAIVNLDEILIVKIKHHQEKFPLKRVDFFLDEQYLGSSEQKPFEFSFDPDSVYSNNGSANLKLIAYDSVKNRSEINLNIYLRTRN